MKRILLLAVLVAIYLAPSMRAGEVTFEIETNAGFDRDPTTSIGLSFTSSLFALGFRGVGEEGSTILRGTTAGGALLANLGTLTLGPGSAEYAGHALTVAVLFVSPFGIEPGDNTGLFTAELSGSVTPSGGLLLIDFPNSPTQFQFNDPRGTGRFRLALNDVAIPAGGTAALTGSITEAYVVPEPSTFALAMGAAASLMIVGVFRRARS